MDRMKSRRGRPRGSGIDDSRLLREIAEMIIEDPELKPTTAIKGTGISDPSTIRRLRDKFRENREALLRETASPRQAEHRIDRVDVQNASHRPNSSDVRTMALKHRREPARTGPVAGPAGCAKAKPAAKDSDEESRRKEIYATANDLTARRMLSDSLRAASAVWQMQFLVASQTIQSPLVRSLMHYQLALSQCILGLGTSQPGTRRAQY